MDEMNDVNEFMSRFNDNYELKWGIALDKDLDKRVKVTILATGFGIKDVDMMSSHLQKQTIEEANRRAEEAEEAARKQDRRQRYYDTAQQGIYKRRPHIYIFKAEDLDNEDVILNVENTPTWKRTKQQLDSIRKQATGNEVVESKESSERIEGIISFT